MIGDVKRIRGQKESGGAPDDAVSPAAPDDVVSPAAPEGTGTGPADDLKPIDSPAHDQWLLDEALAETFLASDPISPSAGKRG